ncbi:hypothetical protein BU23DRAFT_483124 [Bimuria novae-zelandiae CBS 107.79]|uniref:Survival Motor Neuron Gemin2-binding domain-containing protein n=1 Tax=Bimuria novae-zelandiae CBS 107.79 TaxID=1447943 RepID=A0A6A5USB9_9PLEO|nr:hypothetical protein BU23DRAFT_483124 [Bimuria novae-zelandiae CBS 107.79]
MAPGISLDDRSAWDDSALVNSWNDAVAEYQKYHSIAKSGKRLEDVLTEEELQRLRGDYGDLLDEETGSGADPNRTADAAKATQSQAQTNGSGPSGPNIVHAKRQDGAAHMKQENAQAMQPEPTHESGLLSDSMPQALLGSVQDDNMKNLMMSWYYAGYYTGLVAGQQQPSPGNRSQQKQQ